MQLIIELIIFSIAIVVLAKCSHWVINSSIKIAKYTRLSEMVVGFILLSVATSLPELAVSFSAVVTEDVGMSVGNLLGSNIMNICLIIGLAAIIRPMMVSGKALKNLTTILFLSSLIPVLLLNITVASSIIGVILVLTFILFCFYSVKEKIVLENMIFREPTKIFQKIILPFKFYKSIFVLIGGLAGLIISSRFVVDSASSIATLAGIKGAVIGATVIAFGTSLPEFSLFVSALRKGHIGLALGDTIGSCLVNLTLVLGVVLAFSQFAVNMTIFTTLTSFVIGSTILLWFFLGSLGRRKLDRREGLILFLLYVAFIFMAFSIQILI